MYSDCTSVIPFEIFFSRNCVSVAPGGDARVARSVYDTTRRRIRNSSSSSRIVVVVIVVIVEEEEEKKEVEVEE